MDAKGGVASNTEEPLPEAFCAEHLGIAAKGNLKDPRLPQFFSNAIKTRAWCEAIDHEYNALRKRGTLTFVKRHIDTNLILIT